MSATGGRFKPELFNAAAARRIRERRGWTRGQLAARLDSVGVKTIASWEAGLRTPRPAHFLALRQALEVDSADLLTESRDRWPLPTLRMTEGHEMKAVAARLGVSPERLRYIENGANPLTPQLAEQLASMYRTTRNEIQACWQRARDALLT